MMLNESHEDRWVAALCHASGIIFMIGLVVPLVAWITQKDRSPLIRFQAMQAVIFQISGMIVYFLTMILYMGSFFLFFFSAILMGGDSGTPDFSNPGASAIMILFFIVIAIVMLVMFVGTPLYFVLMLIASIRVARGHDFRYPIVGKLIARWLPDLQS